MEQTETEDPGFLRDGTHLQGRQPSIWSIFPENCMKMKKFQSFIIHTQKFISEKSWKSQQRKVREVTYIYKIKLLKNLPQMDSYSTPITAPPPHCPPSPILLEP